MVVALRRPAVAEKDFGKYQTFSFQPQLHKPNITYLNQTQTRQHYSRTIIQYLIENPLGNTELLTHNAKNIRRSNHQKLLHFMYESSQRSVFHTLYKSHNSKSSVVFPYLFPPSSVKASLKVNLNYPFKNLHKIHCLILQ